MRRHDKEEELTCNLLFSLLSLAFCCDTSESSLLALIDLSCEASNCSLISSHSESNASSCCNNCPCFTVNIWGVVMRTHPYRVKKVLTSPWSLPHSKTVQVSSACLKLSLLAFKAVYLCLDVKVMITDLVLPYKLVVPALVPIELI